MEIYYSGELTRAHDTDRGYDLRAKRVTALQESLQGRLCTAQDMEKHPFQQYYKFEFPVVLKAGQRVCIDTGVIVGFPENAHGEIWPRSGLAFEYGIDVLAGLIDPDYRNTIKVILINLGHRDWTINQNDRIAQLVVKTSDSLPTLLPGEEPSREVTRGLSGFGSSGKA